MEVQMNTCAGLDVHTKSVVACVLTGVKSSLKTSKEIRTFGTTTEELHHLGKWLRSKDVEKALMESTGQYWCPVWNILEEYGLTLALANPQRIKGIPGRKTDQKDSEWIAELGRLNLVASSFVPSREIQELRALTRTRTSYKHERTQHKNRLQNVLQHANIKLADFITDIFTGSGLKCLEALLNGEVMDEKKVERLISGRCKHTPLEISKSLEGSFSVSQRELVYSHLRMIQSIENEITILTKNIEEITSHYVELIELFHTIPGVKKEASEIILAEVGPNVSQFASSKSLASWAGLCPGSYESGGVRKTAHITPGNKYLKSILYQCGGVAGRSLNYSFSDLYQRVSRKGSKKKAIIACAHKSLRIIYKILEDYQNRINEKSLSNEANI